MRHRRRFANEKTSYLINRRVIDVLQNCILALLCCVWTASIAPAQSIHGRITQRHIGFALLTSTGVVALLYLMIQVVCIGTLPGLANSERPLADAGSRFLGASGASILSVGALISVTGTLNSTMLAGPRILFAMAEQGQLPQTLAATHRRFRTPHIAILTSEDVRGR